MKAKICKEAKQAILDWIENDIEQGDSIKFEGGYVTLCDSKGTAVDRIEMYENEY